MKKDKFYLLKAYTWFVLMVIGYIASWGLPVWVLVEFILYLVKDFPFNWWSIGLMPVSWVVLIVSMIKVKKMDNPLGL